MALLIPTPCGFQWGPMTVERCTTEKANGDGWLILSVKTDVDTIYIRVTKTGRVSVTSAKHGTLGYLAVPQ